MRLEQRGDQKGRSRSRVMDAVRGSAIQSFASAARIPGGCERIQGAALKVGSSDLPDGRGEEHRLESLEQAPGKPLLLGHGFVQRQPQCNRAPQSLVSTRSMRYRAVGDLRSADPADGQSDRRLSAGPNLASDGSE